MSEDKALRIKQYSETMRKEIGPTAHSCGVAEPRQLRRYHCRIVQDDGRSIPLNELYPEVAQITLPNKPNRHLNNMLYSLLATN